MRYRFIQKYRKGDRVYHPGESADEFSETALKKLVKEGIVAEMAQPEVINPGGKLELDAFYYTSASPNKGKEVIVPEVDDEQ